MAKQTIKITRQKVKKYGKGTSYKKCDKCHGTGRVKK